jgi:YidC/Oxa1 family membrane protein insertase
MDKKSIIAFILIGIVLILWPLYQSKILGIKPASIGKSNEPATQVSKIKEEAVKNSSSQGENQKRGSTKIDDETKTQGIDDLKSAKVDTVILENNLFRGSLSSIGGGTIISWKLKKYYGNDGKWVELIPDSALGNLGLTSRWIKGMDLQRTVFDVVSDTEWVEKGKKFRKVHDV